MFYIFIFLFFMFYIEYERFGTLSKKEKKEKRIRTNMIHYRSTSSYILFGAINDACINK